MFYQRLSGSSLPASPTRVTHLNTSATKEVRSFFLFLRATANCNHHCKVLCKVIVIHFYALVVFTPNKVHISNGDQAIVQCVVEFYQENPPQTFMYVNDCKMMGFNHPYWITKIMQIDAPCSYTDSSKLCRTLTMYINGTEEAHNSRVYCCARIGGRVCSPNSTISVVEAPQPSLTEPTGLLYIIIH